MIADGQPQILPKRRKILGMVTFAVLVLSALVSLVVAPPDALQGEVQRLMYVHVPAAWLAYLAFAVVFIGSIRFLKTKDMRWDQVAHASAEIGVVFTALAILLGSIWGKPIWGVWWTWDPRLTTTAVLLLIYLGYLAVHRLSDNPLRRGKWAAVVGIIGFLDVPVVHFSVLWWRSLHQPPTVIRPAGPAMAGSMLFALLLAVGAFTLLYAYLMAVRVGVARLEHRLFEQTVRTDLPDLASAAMEVSDG